MNEIVQVHRQTEAQSPFLPGTHIQFAWDSTSLGYLKTCPRLYQYVMIDGWGSADESIHLRFGIELHQALQDFDKFQAAGDSREEALRRVVKDCMIRTADWRPDEDTKAGKYKNRTSLIRTIIDYIDHYANDPAKTYILADGKPAVELSFRFELDWGPQRSPALVEEGKWLPSEAQPYLLSGHLDKVVDFNGDLYVMDYKTTTSTPGSYYFDQYDPNNQMTLYTLASQIILGTPIKGVIVNAIQVGVGFTRPVRGFSFRTSDRLDEWLVDLRHWLTLAEHYATIGYWPQNDTACDKFGGCRFREICSKSPMIREQFLKSRFVKLPEEERWNPLRPR